MKQQNREQHRTATPNKFSCSCFFTHLVIAQTVQKPHAQKQISCSSVWPDEIGLVPPLDLEACKNSTFIVIQGEEHEKDEVPCTG